MVRDISRERSGSDPADERDVDPEAEITPALQLAFSPLHKAAFGVATGCAGATLLGLMTMAAVLNPAAKQFPLHLLRQFFAGYSVTWSGVLVGAAWGFAVGFVAGWFAAFTRNLALAISAFVIRTRAELNETRDFLDHI